jgi:dienelactone hydrolase
MARQSAPAEHAAAAAEAVRRAAGGSPLEVESAVRRYVLRWHLDLARRVLRRLGLLVGALFVLNTTSALSLEMRLLHDAQGAVGLLTMPQSVAPVPAVMIVHDSLGIDRRAQRTVHQLLEAGVAALEIELYAVSADGADGAAALDPKAEAEVILRARRALAETPAIDGARLAALGFGRGAHAVALAPAGAGWDWMARVLLYPACAALARELSAGAGASRAPLLLLYGDAGTADPPHDCLRLASSLDDAGAPARLIRYAGASHAWDLPPVGANPVSFQPDPAGGGTLRAVPWPQLAEMSATQAAGFLATAMAAR